MKTSFKALAHSFLAQLSSGFKFSYILGSKAAFFNASQCISPLIGFWSGPLACLVVFMLRTGFSWATAVKAAPFVILLSFHLPTLCGALYLSSSSASLRILRVLFPLLAICVFVTHPIGSQAYYYSFYWFIPALIALLNTRSIFLQALGSTFITHATGTIIWLYTHSLTPADWQLLTGIVWLERLVIALGMTCVYYAILFVQTRSSSIPLALSPFPRELGINPPQVETQVRRSLGEGGWASGAQWKSRVATSFDKLRMSEFKFNFNKSRA